jgi:hypothetical protein
MGQIDPDADGIGLYYDEGASETRKSVEAGLVTLYLAITNPSGAGGISGWYCQNPICWLPPGTYVWAFTPYYAYGPVDPCPDLNYEVVPPLSSAPIVIVAEFVLMVDVPECVEFFIRPLVNGQVIGYTGVPGISIPLHPSSGDSNLPVAQLNCDCTVVQSMMTTWGRVKAMY